MKFTSIPSNGSSWSNPLPFSFDTESDKPIDVTIDIISGVEVIAHRKMYGVSTGTIDIAPYLRVFSCRPPTISSRATITTSPSSLLVRVVVNGVPSNAIKLFHSTFDSSTPGLISYATPTRCITRGEPIIVTSTTSNTITVNIKYTSPTETITSTLSAKTTGLPVNIIIPTSNINPSITSIVLELGTTTTPLATMTYRIIEANSHNKYLMWYNKSGGIETYLFTHVIRTSYEAVVEGEDSGNIHLPARVKEASAHYRLCSAQEPQSEIERLSEIVFSPRVFLIEGTSTTPVVIDRREVIFDSHGTLKQLCLDITEPWKGGVR